MAKELEPLFQKVLSKYAITFLSFDEKHKDYLLGLIPKTDFKRGKIKGDNVKLSSRQIHFGGESLEGILEDVIAEMNPSS